MNARASPTGFTPGPYIYPLHPHQCPYHLAYTLVLPDSPMRFQPDLTASFLKKEFFSRNFLWECTYQFLQGWNSCPEQKREFPFYYAIITDEEKNQVQGPCSARFRQGLEVQPSLFQKSTLNTRLFGESKEISLQRSRIHLGLLKGKERESSFCGCFCPTLLPVLRLG